MRALDELGGGEAAPGSLFRMKSGSRVWAQEGGLGGRVGKVTGGEASKAARGQGVRWPVHVGLGH